MICLILCSYTSRSGSYSNKGIYWCHKSSNNENQVTESNCHYYYWCFLKLFCVLIREICQDCQDCGCSEWRYYCQCNHQPSNTRVFLSINRWIEPYWKCKKYHNSYNHSCIHLNNVFILQSQYEINECLSIIFITFHMYKIDLGFILLGQTLKLWKWIWILWIFMIDSAILENKTLLCRVFHGGVSHQRMC